VEKRRIAGNCIAYVLVYYHDEIKFVGVLFLVVSWLLRSLADLVMLRGRDVRGIDKDDQRKSKLEAWEWRCGFAVWCSLNNLSAIMLMNIYISI
jgi:hypothetical protein